MRAAPNPFAPLTALEIREVSSIVSKSGHLPPTADFAQIYLDEPPKEAVLRNSSAPRRAFAVVYDMGANTTGEAIVDLTSDKLVSWKVIPHARASEGTADFVRADRIVRADRSSAPTALARRPPRARPS
ncbi:MAG: Amine oxidase (copper-containing), partial [Candidatus Solibacter sp.]|nr:Amine oxidase (copper-containing) [Candidatus Solibacter sp.]